MISAASPLSPSPVRRALALWVVLLAFFMDLLDSTIVNVAIPSIRASLGATYADVQWVVAGYALAFAVCLITGGRLGDIFGYKRVFVLGIAGFSGASALCGLADSSAMLIAARALQGVMAALMVPQILAIMQVLYAPHERAHVSAVYGAVAGIATVSGPILGALLIAADPWGMGWRAIFIVNVPVGVVALALGVRYLPDAKSAHSSGLDLVGVALALIAMLLLMVPMIQGRELGWPSWCLASLALSSVAFVAFGRSQRRIERRGGTPLVAPELFRTRSFIAGNAIAGTFFGVLSGFSLALVVFLQVGLHYTVLEAGMTGIPFSLGVSVAAALTGSIFLPRFGRRVLSAGPLVMAGGFALLALTSRHYGHALTPFQLLPALVISGLGMGCVVASIVPFTLADVPLSEAGSASGVVNAIDQVGAALGVAAFGAWFLSTGESRGDFQRAFEATLGWQIATLLAISAATFLLPMPPRLHPLEAAALSDDGPSRTLGEAP
jgi:EmrB/QacA subfamily drug resistance transporter